MRIVFLGLVAYTAGLVLHAGPVAGRGPDAESAVPVTVVAAVKPATVRAGDPIAVEITVTNGLKGEIVHTTFGLTPTDWHGETANVWLMDIHRDGVKRTLFLARPRIDAPKTVAGTAGHRIPPGKSLTIRTDARKWTIDGDWKPGRYEVTARVDGLAADGGRCRLSVQSAPFQFEIQ